MKPLFRKLIYSSLFVCAAGVLARAQAPATTTQSSPPVPVAASAPDSKPAGAPKANAPSSPLITAQELYRSGKLLEAVDAYNAIIKDDPKSAAAYVGLARIDLRQHKLADSEAAVAKAVELAPNSNDVHIAQGEVHFREGKIIEAQNDFTPIVKANGPEARAYLGLGRVYWAGSLRMHAKLMYELAHDHDPDDPDIRRAWLFTLNRKQRIEALKGLLSEDEGEDEEDRSHLESNLAAMEEAEQQKRTGCRLVSKLAETHLPMDRLNNGAKYLRGYGLKVRFNDAVTGTLLIDTGSSGIVISRRVAEKAGIKPLLKTDIHGIGDKGAAASSLGVADSIKIGDLEFQGCHIAAMQGNSVAEQDGLIGADVFSHYLVNIDFPHWKMHLTPLPDLPPLSDSEKVLVAKYPRIAGFRDRYTPPELKSYTPVFRFGHMLLIQTKINDLPPKLFLVDTGSFSDTISPEAAREVTKVRQDSNIHVKGLSGEVNKVFTADNLSLTFSHFRQPARDIIAFDTTHISDSTGVEVSGMLGFAMLYQMQVKIDYRDGLIDFDIDPSRVQ